LWEDYESITDVDSPTAFWNETYAAIAQANQALQSLDQLGESTSRSSALRGEALLARAYAHFLLVNIFSLRYDPATAATTLGVPYVTRPEENAIVNYERETLAETYRLIEEDLTQGLALVNSAYTEPKFHFTTRAAHAFASRFYLYKGDWERVIQSANIVLGSGSPSAQIRDYVSATANERTYSERTLQYSSAGERANLLLAWTYSLQGRNFAAYRYGLSAAKLNELFADPSTNPFGKPWAYSIFGIDGFYNLPKYDEYFRITNVSAGTGIPSASMVHLTTDEVLLNRAEAYVMLNRFDEASADLTQFLSQKIEEFDPNTDVVSVELMLNTYPPSEMNTRHGIHSVLSRRLLLRALQNLEEESLNVK